MKGRDFSEVVTQRKPTALYSAIVGAAKNESDGIGKSEG